MKKAKQTNKKQNKTKQKLWIHSNINNGDGTLFAKSESNRKKNCVRDQIMCYASCITTTVACIILKEIQYVKEKNH